MKSSHQRKKRRHPNLLLPPSYRITGGATQATVNIGMIGHIDHGKTTLTEALTGVWTDTHSEEIKRGITIKLGYADVSFYRCPECERYSNKSKCPYCGAETEFLRRVSFVDAPGHEMLMATMLSGAAIMDGALLVVAANEPCPQPQTKEHVMALEILGVKNIVVVQNKVELVSKEKAIENYQQIKNFLEGTSYRDAPIIPVSAIHKANIDKLIEAIESIIPTPPRDLSKPPLLPVARSFDVNKPGTKVENLKGGVVGGTILRGRLSVGDEIEIRPGIPIVHKDRTTWQHLTTKIASIHAGDAALKEAVPGGLVGLGTMLDPSLTKADALVGSVVGRPGALPPVWNTLELEVHLLERVVGLPKELEVKSLTHGELLMLNIGTAARLATITSVRGDRVSLALKTPVCAEAGSRVAISRKIANKWRLIGHGTLKAG
ncbi:MAG: translation initiation factor IF-2 subunit gamma [Candidatus Hadarchaeales archaeon]